MTYYSNEAQRQQEARKNLLGIVVFMGALILVAVLTGCSNLQANVHACLDANRTTSYTLNGRSESFTCEAKK